MAYKQHFIEWFSGKQIPSYWNTSGTVAMADEVDGGVNILTGTGNYAGAGINFTLKRQYSATGSHFISVHRFNQSGTLSHNSGVGMCRENRFDSGGEQAVILISNASGWSNFGCRTYDSVPSGGATEGSIPVDTSYHSFKLELGTSDVKSYIDGVLDVTRTSSLPSNSLMPCYGLQKLTGTGTAISYNINYCEAYNT
jgi:hypothetical protein